MSHISLQKIAELAGVSKSTVSCALNYCGGVDPQTASAIRQLAKELGYTPIPGIAPFCCAILPEKPHYYWHTAVNSLSECLRKRRIPSRMALYPSLNDLDDFFSALDTLLALSPRVLVLSVPLHQKVKKHLKIIAEKTPIFLLSERMEGKNIFYFSSDERQDGVALAEAFRTAYPFRRRMLILDSACNKERDDSFVSACGGIEIVRRIKLPEWHYSHSAILARRIAAEATGPFDCVYCGTGVLPSVCLALDKLGVPRDVVCIGYENPPSNSKFWENGRLGLTLCQDIAGQSELCAKAIADWYERSCLPQQNDNFVDSRVVYNPNNI